MTPKLSVVIAVKNEWRELLCTIKSIRDTAGDFVQVVVVDDYSSTRITIDQPGVVVINNREWLGVGPSRHLGVKAAASDKILIVDSHSRFGEGWLKAALDALDCSDKLLVCGQCLGLDAQHMDLRKPAKAYSGARMIISDPHAEPRYRILNAAWREDVRGQDFYPLSAVMGAAYGFHKKFFLDIGGLEILRGWGKDEELLSLKWLLCGGDIRMCKSLKVGHIFRLSAQKVPYLVAKDWYFYNVIATALICCPAVICGELVSSLGNSPAVLQVQQEVTADLTRINAASLAFNARQKRSWADYLNLIAQIDASH